MCCTFFLIHYKTHSIKTLESNSNNTYWKILVNFNLPKMYSYRSYMWVPFFKKNEKILTKETLRS
jgi:hypothetical protein